MTRIAVTVGSGKLGRAVIADLTAHGNEVVNLDVAAFKVRLTSLQNQADEHVYLKDVTVVAK